MIEGWGLAAAAVVAGGAVAGAAISSSGAKSAAQTSANAAQAGANTQLQMFNTTQADYAPQIALGQGAANMLSSIYGVGGTGTGGSASGQPNPNYSAFYNTPGYQFTLNQGENQINRAAAANGSLYSSNTLTSLNNYAQNTASTQYNSYINQLLSMAGLGNAAASGVGSAATTTGQGVANSLLNAGNANASGVLGSANAFSNALGSISNGFSNPNSPLGQLFGSGINTNPYNLGGSIPVGAGGAPLLYDADGNITGIAPSTTSVPGG
jgi:hypothetical protein